MIRSPLPHITCKASICKGFRECMTRHAYDCGACAECEAWSAGKANNQTSYPPVISKVMSSPAREASHIMQKPCDISLGPTGNASCWAKRSAVATKLNAPLFCQHQVMLDLSQNRDPPNLVFHLPCKPTPKRAPSLKDMPLDGESDFLHRSMAGLCQSPPPHQLLELTSAKSTQKPDRGAAAQVGGFCAPKTLQSKLKSPWHKLLNIASAPPSP